MWYKKTTSRYTFTADRLLAIHRCPAGNAPTTFTSHTDGLRTEDQTPSEPTAILRGQTPYRPRIASTLLADRVDELKSADVC